MPINHSCVLLLISVMVSNGLFCTIPFSIILIFPHFSVMSNLSGEVNTIDDGSCIPSVICMISYLDPVCIAIVSICVVRCVVVGLRYDRMPYAIIAIISTGIIRNSFFMGFLCI